MNKLERVDAVLADTRPDRPPFSFWYHFGPDAVAGPAAVEAHVRHVEEFNLDFLKIMDDNRYPAPQTASGALESAADLDRLQVLRGDEDTFGRQLELIGALARRYSGQLRMVTTVFNSWATLRHMVLPDSGERGRPGTSEVGDAHDIRLSELLHEAPTAVARALEVIAESLANFVQHALKAGADGVFLSVRDDWVDTDQNGEGVYDRVVQPGDRRILAAASAGHCNMVHACGKPREFGRFAHYPAHAINWADRSVGPALGDVVDWLGPVPCAGLDHLGTMAHGSAQDCARQVADAVEQAGDRPFMLAPGCTYDPQAVPRANLDAIRAAVEALA